MSTLNRSGRALSKRTLNVRPVVIGRSPLYWMESNAPITVLMPQCGTVGVNSISTLFVSFETLHWGAETTINSSSVMCLCSGSVINLTRSIQKIMASVSLERQMTRGANRKSRFDQCFRLENNHRRAHTRRSVLRPDPRGLKRPEYLVYRQF